MVCAASTLATPLRLAMLGYGLPLAGVLVGVATGAIVGTTDAASIGGLLVGLLVGLVTASRLVPSRSFMQVRRLDQDVL